MFGLGKIIPRPPKRPIKNELILKILLRVDLNFLYGLFFG